MSEKKPEIRMSKSLRDAANKASTPEIRMSKSLRDAAAKRETPGDTCDFCKTHVHNKPYASPDRNYMKLGNKTICNDCIERLGG